MNLKLNINLIVILISCFSLSLSTPVDPRVTENTCVVYSVPQQQLSIFREISGQLNTFLDRNLDNGVKSLMKVLSKSGYDNVDNEESIEEEAPLESYLLQHQIHVLKDTKKQQDLMLQELKEQQVLMLQEIKELKIKEQKIKEQDLMLLEFKSQIIENLKELKKITIKRPMDCIDILLAGYVESGVYTIFPSIYSMPTKVYCDLETDGGGWTVLLNRMETSEQMNFYRNWEDYKNGFGSPDEEYWLGNENLHLLTSSRNYTFRLDAKDENEKSTWGEWRIFKVDSELMKYKLTVERYNTESAARDSAFSGHNGQKFSTYDQDNDAAETGSCAESYKGGWWYRKCSNINPTGVFGDKSNSGIKIFWWTKSNSSALHPVSLQLKIRPHDLHLRMH